MEGGKRREIENEEARDRKELFYIGVFSDCSPKIKRCPHPASKDVHWLESDLHS